MIGIKSIGGIILALFVACMCESLHGGIAPVLMNPYTTNTPAVANAQVVTVVTPYLNSATNLLDASLRAALAQTNITRANVIGAMGEVTGSGAMVLSNGPTLLNTVNRGTLFATNIDLTQGDDDNSTIEAVGGQIILGAPQGVFASSDFYGAFNGIFRGSGELVTNVTAARIIAQTNIDFVTNAATPAWVEGRVFYDPATHTLCYYTDRSAVTVNIGQEQHVRIVNKTGAMITNGNAVTIQGAQGNRPKGVLAQATTNASSAGFEIIGMATENIPINSEGLVTTLGVVNGIDTRAYTDGAALYCSTNAGVLTTNRYNDDVSRIPVGIALNSTVNGSIFVHPQDPIHLDDVPGLISALTYLTNNAGGGGGGSGLLVTNTTTGNWILLTNGVETLGPTNSVAKITLDGVNGGITQQGVNGYIIHTNGVLALGTNGSAAKITLDGVSGSITNTYILSTNTANGNWLIINNGGLSVGQSNSVPYLSIGSGGSLNGNIAGASVTFAGAVRLGTYLYGEVSGSGRMYLNQSNRVQITDSGGIIGNSRLDVGSVFSKSILTTNGITSYGDITTSTTFTATNGIAVPQKRLNFIAVGNTNVTLSISTNYSGTYYLVLTNNAYFTQPTNMTAFDAGQLFYVSLKQDSVGARTVGFDTNYWKFPSGQILTTPTNANSWSVMSCIVSPTADSIGVVQTLNFQ